MTLSELAVEYKNQAERIKEYLDTHPLTKDGTAENRRKYSMYLRIYRDTMAIAKYLNIYYEENRQKSAFGRYMRFSTKKERGDDRC